MTRAAQLTPPQSTLDIAKNCYSRQGLARSARGGFMIVRMLAAAVLAALFGARAVAAPLEAYGRLPTLENVKISPDGNTLAYTRSAPGKRFVVIHSLQTNQIIGAINIGDAKLRDLSWADD